MSFFNPSARVRRVVTFYAQVLQALAIILAGGWAAFTYHHELRRPYYEKQLNLYLEASKVVADMATLPEGDERHKADIGESWPSSNPRSVEGMMRYYCDRTFDVSECDHRQSPNPRLGDALDFSRKASEEIKGHWRASNP